MGNETFYGDGLTDIRDFTTLFYVIFRHKSSEWLESSMQSVLGMRVPIWSLDLDNLSSNTVSSVRAGY